MDKLRSYILKNFSSLFFSLFLPLYAIGSIVFMVKLATYTSVIQLTPLDMLTLYLFILPELFFYTLPVTFFIAAVLTLFRLSNDNEMIVIFSLGIRPSFIIKTLSLPATLLSILLAFDFFVMFPHATVLSTNFIFNKKGEAQFNLSASEFGHRFGDWMLYIGESDNNNSYSNVVLFNTSKKDEIFVSATHAQVLNENDKLRLKLNEGEGYTYSPDELTQISFDQMIINDVMRYEHRKYRTTLDFWLSHERKENKIKMFITDVLITLFPLLTLPLVLAIGIVHTRHQKGHVYLYMFIAVVLYYGLTIGLQQPLMFYTIPVVVVLSLTLSYYFYQRKVLKRY